MTHNCSRSRNYRTDLSQGCRATCYCSDWCYVSRKDFPLAKDDEMVKKGSYHNSVWIHNGMKTVSYRQHSALLELFTDGGLDQRVRPVKRNKTFWSRINCQINYFYHWKKKNWEHQSKYCLLVKSLCQKSSILRRRSRQSHAITQCCAERGWLGCAGLGRRLVTRHWMLT